VISFAPITAILRANVKSARRRGFGDGKFRALFSLIEEDLLRRGVLAA